jgi:hypothetical protein
MYNFEILGVHILDRGDPEALSLAAASRNGWDFLPIVVPLPIAYGTGSAVNLIAAFWEVESETPFLSGTPRCRVQHRPYPNTGLTTDNRRDRHKRARRGRQRQ